MCQRVTGIRTTSGRFTEEPVQLKIQELENKNLERNEPDAFKRMPEWKLTGTGSPWTEVLFGSCLLKL